MAVFNKFNENLTREDLVATEFTPYVTAVGKFQSLNVKDEDYQKYSDNVQAQIADIMEDVTNKGNNNLTILDMLNLNTLQDQEVINPDMETLLHFASTLVANIQTLKSLGINYSDFTFSDVSMTNYKITKVNIKVAEKLMEAILALNSGGGEELRDVIFDATYDFVSQRMSPYLYLTEMGLVNDVDILDKSPDDLIQPYIESYNDWVLEETGKVLEAIATNPSVAVVIHPLGLDELKADIKKFMPAESHSYIDEQDWYDINGVDFIKVCMSFFKEPKDQQQIARRIVVLLEDMSKKNAGADIPTGENETTKVSHAVSIADIVILAMSKASDNLFLLYDELHENTYTIKSLYDEAMVDLGLEVNEVSPWRIMSTVAKAIPVTIAQSLLLRLTNQEFGLASKTLGTILLQMLAKKEKDEELEGVEE